MSPPPGDPAWQNIAIPAAVLRTAQGEGDLGERMARAVRRVTAEAGQRVQFERNGYFCVDTVDSQPGKPVFNRILDLKDSFKPGK